MNNLSALLYYEMKKIVSQRSTQMLIAAIILATLFINCRDLLGTAKIRYLDDTGQIVTEEVSILSAVQMERKYARMYSGQPLDDELIGEMKGFVQEHGYDCMNMYWIYHTIYELGLNPEGDLASEEGIAGQLKAQQEDAWNSLSLTDHEIDVWQEETEKIELPLRIAYTRGYTNMIENAHWLNMMLVFFIIIILCDSFSKDWQIHTRSLIQSSRNGYGSGVYGRILAGIIVTLAAAICVYLLSAIIQFGIHGCDGWSVPIQQVCSDLVYSSLSISAGHAMLFLYGTSIVLLLMVAALTMMMSQLSQNAVVALAIPFVLLFLSMVFEVGIFYRERDLSQIWRYFPIQRIDVDMLCDHRLVHMFGISVKSIPFSFIFYSCMIITAIIICITQAKVTKLDKQ